MQGAGRFSGKPIPLALVQRFWLGVFFGAELSAAFRYQSQPAHLRLRRPSRSRAVF